VTNPKLTPNSKTAGGLVRYNDRHCGRVLGTQAADTVTFYAGAANSVCTGFRPFRMTVNFDEHEVAISVATTITTEQFGAPGGIVGFALSWAQRACT
jgi:hypothetical protein